MAVQFNPFTGNLDFVGAGAATTPGGSDTQVQFNDGGSFGGSADLTWDDTAKELGVGGDINLDDGGTYETTVQVVTPTANRTISFPDATGTVALVAGSTGQLTYNNAGAQAGLASANIGSTGEINISLAGAASTPPVSFTGSWFTGGTSTTTKPQLLIEPNGTTSTAWSTSGTGLGVNAASGFAGNLLDLQVNGSSRIAFTPGAQANGGLISFGTGTLVSNSSIGAALSWSNQSTIGVNGSGTFISQAGIGTVQLSTDATNIFAQRNSTAAQTFRVYNTYTDASNYERHTHSWSGNVLNITNEAAGSGTLRGIAFGQNGTDSTPPVAFTGTWFTGGTSTTTKPQLLIEPTGTTSTAWSTSGTGLGVNAPSGFAGNLLDLQVHGSTRMKVDANGTLDIAGDLVLGPNSAPAVKSDTTGVTGADQITNMMSLTQAEYDAIVSPDANTFYVITA